MQKSAKCYRRKKGMAMLEAFPIIWVMFVLMGATLGSWGVVHTAILRSIAARNYIFFLFNNRSDLAYLRDFDGNSYTTTPPLGHEVGKHYYRYDAPGGGLGHRFSYIQSDEEPNPGVDVYATLRRVDFQNFDDYGSGLEFLSDDEHKKISSMDLEKRNKKKVKKVWIMVGYGICLNAKCGDP